MTTASKKAKGRSLQKLVRDWLLTLGKPYGIQPGDVQSTSMGASGVDVKLSPAANTVFGRLAIECKNQESLNVVTTFLKHADKYPDHLPILFHKKNHTPTLVTMRLLDFELYFKESLDNLLCQSIEQEQHTA